MKYREIHPQFNDTFEYYPTVPSTIREGLWNYVSYGLPPGSFMQAVLEGNFFRAMQSADSSWAGRSFKDLAKWVTTTMPYSSYGSPEQCQAWVKLTDEERYDIMVEMRLRPNEFDILRGNAVA